MKIYFLGVRDPKMKKLYGHILDVLKSGHHSVTADWMDTTSEEDSKNFEDSYKRNMSAIKSSDIVIAETSLISSGLGFQVATALSQHKPVIALYNQGYSNQPSATLKGSSNKNKLLYFREYTKDSELKNILPKAINQVRSAMDTKFILIIPAEIDRYLQWASDYKRMHKAQVVREAIEKYMDTDKDWQEFLNDDTEI